MNDKMEIPNKIFGGGLNIIHILLYIKAYCLVIKQLQRTTLIES